FLKHIVPASGIRPANTPLLSCACALANNALIMEQQRAPFVAQQSDLGLVAPLSAANTEGLHVICTAFCALPL
ncbi:hypothetical protein H4R20_005560, partial [Coemansia guatemalensis]